jgi:LuxR family maltose regulon positive regulatory protein
MASTSAFQPAFALVEAKLHPPSRRHGAVRRERSLRVLEAGASASVVSVVAPPGFGKTMLLAQWVEDQERPVAWLTIDDFDNVPSVFLSYLAVAIDRIHPLDPAAGADILAPGSRVLAAVVPRLASELHRVGRPAVLVLDDVHRLVDRTCLDALAALIDHLPPDFQVAIAARTPPELPIARWRAGGRLLEIGRADLAMDVDETAALTSLAGRRVTTEQAGALHARTEGWPAAVYLAVLAGSRDQRHDRTPDTVQGTDSYISDYLRSEILDGLGEDDLVFLTRSAVLETVEGPVAEAVVGLAGASERLRSLARRNQLIAEISGSAGAYRYHHLLRVFLLAELERREPGSEAVLRARAAAWYAAAGRTELAIEQALLGDRDAAARLVVTAVLPSVFGGNADTLDRWLQAFDDEELIRHPPLAVTGAWVHLLNGRPRAAEHLADVVDRASYAGDPGDGSSSFEVARAILRCAMGRGRPDELVASARFVVASEPSSSPWRTTALLMLGASLLLTGDRAAAAEALADATQAGAVAGATVAWATLASLAVARGEWNEADRCARESHALIARSRLEHLVVSLPAYSVTARILIHRGDLPGARAELVRAQIVRPLASEAAPWLSVRGLLELSRAYLAMADPAGARSALAEAEAIARRRSTLGTLAEELVEMRQRLSQATSTLAGASSLTAAELRLLPILSTPLTFREIGERLFLSHHTVKTHAISIYGKLGASSRSDAIERAIEIGLLEPYPTLPPLRRGSLD